MYDSDSTIACFWQQCVGGMEGPAHNMLYSSLWDFFMRQIIIWIITLSELDCIIIIPLYIILDYFIFY